MSVLMPGNEVHMALQAAHATRLPTRAILGQWLRELGARAGVATWPGPRRNPGNVIRAHVGQVCSKLGPFPVFCTITDGVHEYEWYFNNLRYYTHIAAEARGSWVRACNLIEASPWSADHYGGTLDLTANLVSAHLVRSTVALANIRRAPSRASAIVGHLPAGPTRLAWIRTVRGESFGGDTTWLEVWFGHSQIGYIHASRAAHGLLPH